MDAARSYLVTFFGHGRRAKNSIATFISRYYPRFRLQYSLKKILDRRVDDQTDGR